MSVIPFAWRDRPSLIEHLLPAQKISAEAQKERKAGSGQTLTALGSYWKGRKPLILAKACILGSLLPATDKAEVDLSIFEMLMAIDDEAFLRRQFRTSCMGLLKRLHSRGLMKAEDAERLFVVRFRTHLNGKTIWEIQPFSIGDIASIEQDADANLTWAEDVSREETVAWLLRWVQSFDYVERVSHAKRPEEIDESELFESVWPVVNGHLGTTAASMSELVEQLGILRFGQRPRVGDTFCGGGSIPFEAARLGCDAFASDLNPIACMLTWGSFHIIGGDTCRRVEITDAQRSAAAAADLEITKLGIEHDSQGNRAKAFLYCLETRCPQTGWMVPMVPSWVVSTKQNVVAKLIPNRELRRFEIEIVSGVSSEELVQAGNGTVRGGDLVYQLDGETYRTPIKTIRGDYRMVDGITANRLRCWGKNDFTPLELDIFQERLYCIQWIRKDSLEKSRPVTFFAAITPEDLIREARVREIVQEKLATWQEQGLVPDMPIEPGEKTDEPIRTRGWKYWHHLFTPRDLLTLSIVHRHFGTSLTVFDFAALLDFSSKLSRWIVRYSGIGGSDFTSNVFSNQALNTLYNWANRGLVDQDLVASYPTFQIPGSLEVVSCDVKSVKWSGHIFITDPPYADAIRYEEITEYFIAWLRKSPPAPLSQWVWDSRRPLAIKGTGDDFRREMTAAYSSMSRHMSDNGLQIIMFTHQDAGVWADMAGIVWGAGLQVTAAWYIATETTSELKKGGYVQGTVLLVLRKRLSHESAYRDELVQEVRAEVARQIETMTGLNQAVKGAGRSENIFEDQDLQMAGYAAALRVLTGYSQIDGQDMAAEALRPKQNDGPDLVKEIIDFAVQVANEHLVPEGIAPTLWERLTGPERFYLRMLDIEAGGAKKLDNYQNFAKAFRYGDYAATMGSMKANDARLKIALEFKRSEFEGDFGKSALRAVLFALYELQRDVDIDEAISHLRDLVPGYLSRREDLMALASVIASKREAKAPAEAQAARILFSRIKNERLG